MRGRQLKARLSMGRPQSLRRPEFGGLPEVSCPRGIMCVERNTGACRPGPSGSEGRLTADKREGHQAMSENATGVRGEREPERFLHRPRIGR